MSRKENKHKDRSDKQKSSGGINKLGSGASSLSKGNFDFDLEDEREEFGFSNHSDEDDE